MWRKIRDDLTTFIIITLFLLTIAYGVVIIYLSTQGCMVPDALTYSWFGLVTGECGIAGLIRCNKRKHGEPDFEITDGIGIDDEELATEEVVNDIEENEVNGVF